MSAQQRRRFSLAARWDIPKPIWTILLSWGMAVLLVAALLSFWISKVQRDQDRENARLQAEKDRAMCVMLEIFTSGPEPVSGPAGDRGRAALSAMRAYQATLRCDQLGPPPIRR